MDRLSCTMGTMGADMVVAERSGTTNIPSFDPLRDDVDIAPVMARVLAMTVAAAHQSLAHIPRQDAEGPAERSSRRG